MTTRRWLKQFRMEKKMTQQEVANKVNISRSHYTHIESGEKSPSPDKAKKIGMVLEFDWTIFFNEVSSLKEHNDAEQEVI